MVGWSHPGYMQKGPAYVRSKPAGGAWRGRVRLTAEGHAVSWTPQLAATTWGQVTAAWPRTKGVASRTKPVGRAWGHVQTVRRRGELLGLGVDDTGTATVLCAGTKSQGTFTMSRPRSGSWHDRTRIGPRGWGATLAVNPTGEAVAAWQAGGHVLASWRNSSTPWPRATILGSKMGPLMNASIGPDDTAVVVWYRYRGDNQSRVVLKGNVYPGRR